MDLPLKECPLYEFSVDVFRDGPYFFKENSDLTLRNGPFRFKKWAFRAFKTRSLRGYWDL